MKQRIAILGSTGSVGANTLDVVSRHPDRFDVVLLSAGSRVEPLLEQCVRWRPRHAVMADAGAARQLAERLEAEGVPTRVRAGDTVLEQLVAGDEVDTVMASIVGAAGLASCLAAARAGKRLLLANKEALVVGGQLFMDAVRTGGATLLPIDSEHSAIFQSLPDDPSTWQHRVDRIILTASGGPFRRHAPEALRDVTPEQACAHPNWVMGRKISVDSATMMNKALEVIEARYLFGLPPDRLEVVIHPQSVIHSMVQYHDHSVVAQLGTPDMRVPIAYGLAWPERIASGAQPLDFGTLQDMSFESLDSHGHRQRFPGLQLAWDALLAPPGSTAVLNAANEEGVAAFLDRRIRFDQIHRVNLATLEAVVPSKPEALADLLALDARAREAARRTIAGLS
jgi:1-deoxy-D-xylulose-5-phosphate reductoisomerase